MTKNLRKLAALRAEAKEAQGRVTNGKAPATQDTARRDLRRVQNEVADVINRMSLEELAQYEKGL